MEAFETLEDPRRRLASCDYPLQELLLTALCAIGSGVDDWVDVIALHTSQAAVHWGHPLAASVNRVRVKTSSSCGCTCPLCFLPKPEFRNR
jgi:hypothetical protein